MTPALNPRVRAHSASKAPDSRVNAIKDLHPNLQDIIKNCPALDVILDYENPRSSTHNRSRARDKEHVARPPNAFMVYRSYVWFTKQLEDNHEKNLSCVSQLAGRSWTVMSGQARAPFKQVADIAKRMHAERNPDYKYAPSSRSQNSQKKQARRASTVKAKESTTARNADFDALPQPKEATSNPSSTSSPASVETTPASFELSCSWSSASSPASSPSTPPESMPRHHALNLPPFSPQLQYPDRDHSGYPPQPRVRLIPMTFGLIPSPSMSVLNLNDAPAPSILDELPDKYKEAESYHNLLPHAFIFKEKTTLDGAEPKTQIPDPVCSPPAETIDYSRAISGNPEVNLGSPTPEHTLIGSFSSGASTTTFMNNDFNSSSDLNWSAFDMPTLDFDRIEDGPGMYYPNDRDLFDSVIAWDD